MLKCERISSTIAKISERAGGEQPRIDLVASCAPTSGVSRIASTPDRREHDARHRRRIAHVLLQPQRQQHHVAEERAVAERHRERAASRNCGARTAAGRRPDVVRQLPDEEQREAHRRDDRQRDDLARRRTSRGSLPLSSMICSAPTQSTTSPRPTPSIGSLTRRRLARPVDHPRDGGGAQSDRDVDVEDPRPRDVVGDPAAEQRTDDRRDERRDAPHRERGAGARLRIARQQQRLRQRNHRARDRALDDAEQDQESERRREAAQERRERRTAAPTSMNSRTCPKRCVSHPVSGSEIALATRERRDDPGSLVRRDAEVARDRRERHVRDRRVEHVHERRERQRDRAEHEQRAGERASAACAGRRGSRGTVGLRRGRAAAYDDFRASRLRLAASTHCASACAARTRSRATPVRWPR